MNNINKKPLFYTSSTLLEDDSREDELASMQSEASKLSPLPLAMGTERMPTLTTLKMEISDADTNMCVRQGEAVGSTTPEIQGSKSDNDRIGICSNFDGGKYELKDKHRERTEEVSRYESTLSSLPGNATKKISVRDPQEMQSSSLAIWKRKEAQTIPETDGVIMRAKEIPSCLHSDPNQQNAKTQISGYKSLLESDIMEPNGMDEGKNDVLIRSARIPQGSMSGDLKITENMRGMACILMGDDQDLRCDFGRDTIPFQIGSNSSGGELQVLLADLIKKEHKTMQQLIDTKSQLEETLENLRVSEKHKQATETQNQVLERSLMSLQQRNQHLENECLNFQAKQVRFENTVSAAQSRIESLIEENRLKDQNYACLLKEHQRALNEVNVLKDSLFKMMGFVQKLTAEQPKASEISNPICTLLDSIGKGTTSERPDGSEEVQMATISDQAAFKTETLLAQNQYHSSIIPRLNANESVNPERHAGDKRSNLSELRVRDNTTSTEDEYAEWKKEFSKKTEESGPDVQHKSLENDTESYGGSLSDRQQNYSNGENVSKSHFQIAEENTKKLEELETMLLKLNIERETLENQIAKIPSGTFGRTVKERKRVQEMESRLDVVNKELSTVKRALRKLGAV